MPIKKSSVRTSVNLFGEWYDIPVLYTEELRQSSVYDLASSAAAPNGFLSYLFVGYFFDNEGYSKWYLANARMHEDLRKAIENEVGRKMEHRYGQIYFRPD